MKENKPIFLEPEVDDLCYLLGQAIARLLEEGRDVRTKDQAHSADSPDESSSENQHPELDRFSERGGKV